MTLTSSSSRAISRWRSSTVICRSSVVVERRHPHRAAAAAAPARSGAASPRCGRCRSRSSSARCCSAGSRCRTAGRLSPCSVGQVDRAEVGEPLHGELGQPLHRLGDVGGRRRAAGPPRAGTPTRSACRAVSSCSRARSSAWPACRPRVQSSSTSAGPVAARRLRLVQADQVAAGARRARARARRAAGCRRSPGRAPGADRPSAAIAAATAGRSARSRSSRVTVRTPCASSSASWPIAAACSSRSRSSDSPTACSVCSRGTLARRRPPRRARARRRGRPAPPGRARRSTAATSATDVAAAMSDTTRCTVRDRASDSSAARCALEQLPLVAPPRGRLEQRRPHQHRRAVVVPQLDGVDQARQHRPVDADDVQRDLPHRALHAQQRHHVGLVEHPAADGEQVLEADAEQVLGRAAGPGAERPVHLDDPPVGQRGEVAHGRVLVEVGRVLLQQPAELRAGVGSARCAGHPVRGTPGSPRSSPPARSGAARARRPRAA